MATPKVSEVRLYSATGLSPDYNHTYRFTDKEVQKGFLGENYTSFHEDSISYIDVTKGVAQFEGRQDQYWNCDYCAFRVQPDSFSNANRKRWWYCFIDEIEYVNDHCFRVHFTIDQIQTWITEVLAARPYLFVEREHIPFDTLFANTVPENIEIGSDYIYEKKMDDNWNNFGGRPLKDDDGTFHNFLPVLLGNFEVVNRRDNDFPGGVYNQLFMRKFKTAYGKDGVEGLSQFLDSLSGDQQLNVIDIFMYPEGISPDGYDLNRLQTVRASVKIPGFKGVNPWGDNEFKPKNNKLYTYPYCYITVSNNCGQAEIYKNELFSDYDEAFFAISGSFGSEATFTCRPFNYNGLAEDYNHTVSLKGLPKCAWVTDMYKAYLAQNASSLAVENALNVGMAAFSAYKIATGSGIISSAGGGVLSGTEAANAISSGVTGLTSVAKSVAKQMDATTMADNAHNAGTAVSAQYSQGQFQFTPFIARIKPEFARIVDNFFTMYGYATNRLKRLNVETRPKYNYIKGSNLCIRGKIPSTAASVWERVISNGITFWEPGTPIGDYSVDNSN